MRVAIAVCLVGGCWVAPPQPASPSPASERAPAPRRGFPLTSVWRGTYRCSQGLSAVKLTIDARENGEAVARYDFGPTESNPDVPIGAFELAGRLHTTGPASFAGELEAVSWIEQPDRYFMVGLTLVSDARGQVLRGEIDHDSCSDFEVRRES